MEQHYIPHALPPPLLFLRQDFNEFGHGLDSDSPSGNTYQTPGFALSEYHYNWTCDANSLSTGQDNSTSAASVAVRSLPSDAGGQDDNSCDESHPRLHPQPFYTGGSHRSTNTPAVWSPNDFDPFFDDRFLLGCLDSKIMNLQSDNTTTLSSPVLCTILFDNPDKAYYSILTDTMLKAFDVDIPEAIQRRFRELRELLVRESMKDASYPGVIPKVDLRVLGTSEATAKPSIIVFSHYTRSEEVMNFFCQQRVKSEYQPPDDSLVPSFEVFVCRLHLY